MSAAVTAGPRLSGRLAAFSGRGPGRQSQAVSTEIVARHGALLSADGRHVVVSRVQLTSTGVLVIVLAPAGRPPCAVLKLPLGVPATGALQRETIALDALREDARLGGWRRLAPRPLARGTLEGQPYRLDSALMGESLHPSGCTRSDLSEPLRAAAAAIGMLHELTRSAPPNDADRCAHWVDIHLHELELRSGRHSPVRQAGPRLRSELHAAVVDWEGTAAAVHGDFWFGNILFDGRPEAGGRVAGIVDWESFGTRELPFHDLLHLLLYARRSASGLELGELVARQINNRRWSLLERELLERHAAWEGQTSMAQRHMLLLYWLRHAAIHARQQPRRAGYRYRLWERRNLLPVLEVL